MIIVDNWLHKTSTDKYKCFDFVRDVWLIHCGIDLLKWRTQKVVSAIREPENPCIIIFRRKGLTPHIGVMVNNRVLHLPSSGAQYVKLSVVARRYNKVSFYK